MKSHIIFVFLLFLTTNLVSQTSIEKYLYYLSANKTFELSGITAEFNTDNGDLCQVEFYKNGKIAVIKTIIPLDKPTNKNASKFARFINSSSGYQQWMKNVKNIKKEISETGWYSGSNSNDTYDYISIDHFGFRRLATERKEKYFHITVSKKNGYSYIIEPIEIKVNNLSDLLSHNEDLYNKRIEFEKAKSNYAKRQKYLEDSQAKAAAIKLQEYNDKYAKEQLTKKIENERKLKERNAERLKVTSVVTEKLLYNIFRTQSKYEKDPFATYAENVNNSKKLIEGYINTKYKLIINENQIRKFYNAEEEEFNDRDYLIIRFENNKYRIAPRYGSVNYRDFTIPIPRNKARNLKSIEVIMSTTGILYGDRFDGNNYYREYESIEGFYDYYGELFINFIIDSYILNYKDGNYEIIEDVEDIVY